MAKTICKILGVAFILIGLVGNVTPNFLGMHLSPMHNAIHLISGAVALYFGFVTSHNAARTFCIFFGIFYILLGILGFIVPETVADLLNAHRAPGTTNSLTPDNVVHLILGLVFLTGGVARYSRTTPIATDATLPRSH